MIKIASRNLALSVFAILAAGAVAAPPNLEQVIESQRLEVASRPADPAVHNDLGNLLLLAHRVDEAERSYRHAKELAPFDVSSRFNLALLLQQEDRLEEASGELTALLEIDPQYAWAHYQLGMLKADEKNRKHAVEHYARAFALDPSLTFARNNPHIIDNELATEALLLSSRYGDSAASKVPRSYGEGARIRELMLRDLTESVEEGDSQPMEKGAPEAASSGSGSASFGDEPAGVAVESARPADPAAAEGEDESATRVLSNEDLAGLAAVGQATGGGGQRGAGSRGSTTGRGSTAVRPDTPDRRALRDRLRRGSEEGGNVRGGTSIGGVEERQPEPRRRYRPSQRSTASLELELLDDTERTAAGM